MAKRALSLSLLLILFAVTVIGCGGRQGSTSREGNLESARLDRITMRAAVAELNRLYQVDPTTAFDQLADYLRANTGVMTVREHGNMVVAVFSNGNSGVFMNPTRGTTNAPLQSRQAGFPGAIPVNGMASIMSSLGSNYTEYGRQLEPVLRQGGYQSGGTVKIGTLADYLRLRGKTLGLLYVDSHGVVLPRDPNDPYDTRWGYYLVCAAPDPNNAEDKALVESYYESRPKYTNVDFPFRGPKPDEVTWITAPIFDPAIGRTSFTDTEAIGVEFFKNKLKFSDHSVVFLNTCYSHHAAEALAAAGAGVSVGWTQPVQDTDANQAAARFFELTANRQGGLVTWERARDQLVSENLHLSQVVGTPQAQLLFSAGRNPGQNVLPRIDSIQDETSLGQIVLRGTFGKALGKVYANGDTARQLPIVRWSATEITVTKVGSVTSLLVESAAGLLSNTEGFGGWLIAGNDRSNFFSPGRLVVTMKSSNFQVSRSIFADSATAGPGERVPIPFNANPGTNPDDHVMIFQFYGVTVDDMDKIRISVYNPSGQQFSVPVLPRQFYFEDGVRVGEVRFFMPIL